MGDRRPLRSRAARQGVPLNRYLLELLDSEAATPTVAEVLERAARRAERPSLDAVDAVQSARDERDDELSERLGR